ncbi:MAG: glycosyltransferase family 4 protein [Eubacterium sp.]|nr:glycosyltransferase family 4 protein [Eubacterium sp.]
MKILFWGLTKGNVGPANINKGICSHLTDGFYSIKSSGKYVSLLEALWKLLWSRVVVVSCVSRVGYILVALGRLLGKKSVYIIHGHHAYESKLNNRAPDYKGLRWEAYIMEHADLLLPVSRKFMIWMQHHYPQYANKTEYIYNGVDERIFNNQVQSNKSSGTIIAAGGVRAEKNNFPVIDAVEKMQGKGKLRIFGGPIGSIAGKKYSKFVGRVSNADFLKAMSQSEIFVLNAIFESFSISVFEALACGCSILVSEVVGATDLLALEESDVIHDPMDVEEIRRKLEYLMEHPNNSRIRSQFHAEEWSFAKMVENLENKCKRLVIME